ncbi:MAG: CPBP family intramembrane glutamic endopeptidase [Alphaproteobacteria bacterium]
MDSLLEPALLVAIAAALVLGLAQRTRSPRLRLDPGEFPARWRAACGVALLVWVIAAIVVQPLVGLAGPGATVDLEGASYARLFAAHAVLGAFLLAWWVLAGFPSPATFLALPHRDLAQRLALGLGAGLGAWVLTIGSMSVVGGGLLWLSGALAPGPDGAAAIAPDAAGVVPEAVDYLVGLSLPRRLLLVASAGVFEEAFFRSFLQPRAGLVLSSLLFTASHAGYGSPMLMIGVLLLSIVLGRLFREKQDVLPCMVAHSVFDAVQLLLVLPLVAAAE